ncbi:MAG: hypothetical protein ACRDS0_23485 [Pseudonocardiaceae bacterium]
MSDTDPTARMTRTERDQLAKLINRRARLARQDIETRQAELLADVEAQLAAHYSSRHKAWADITKRAEKAVADADAEIAARCRELGIPENFRPSIGTNWYGRGENADRERRAELRKVAKTKLEASARNGKLEIERSALELYTQLVAGALESAESQAFLATMPTVEALMPRLALSELESSL